MFPIKYSCTHLRRQCASNAGIRLCNASPDNITNMPIFSINLLKIHMKSSYLNCY